MGNWVTVKNGNSAQTAVTATRPPASEGLFVNHVDYRSPGTAGRACGSKVQDLIKSGHGYA